MLSSRFSLRLEQSMQPMFSDDPEDYYDTLSEFEVDFFGVRIPYVLCPQTRLNHYSHDTTLGFHDGDKIFVSKNLSPTQVPFAAFMIYLESRPKDRLRAVLGESVEGMSYEDMKDVATQVTFETAAETLRPRDMADFIERFRHDRKYDDRHFELMEDIAARYSPDHPDATHTAILARERTSLDFYVERIGEYLRNHQRNKWVRSSKAMLTLQEQTERLSAKGFFEEYIVKCEPVADSVINNERLRAHLPEIVDAILQLEESHKGDRIEISSKATAYVLGMCVNIANPPLRFIDDDPTPDRNLVEITSGHGPEFFAALNRRLRVPLFEEVYARQEALEGVEEVVTRVSAGDRDLRALVQGYLFPDIPKETREPLPIPALPPEDLQIALSEKMVDGTRGLAEVATAAPRDIRDVMRATRVLSDLGGLGLDESILTAAVIDKLRTARAVGYERLRYAVGARALAG